MKTSPRRIPAIWLHPLPSTDVARREAAPRYHSDPRALGEAIHLFHSHTQRKDGFLEPQAHTSTLLRMANSEIKMTSAGEDVEKPEPGAPHGHGHGHGRPTPPCDTESGTCTDAHTAVCTTLRADHRPDVQQCRIRQTGVGMVLAFSGAAGSLHGGRSSKVNVLHATEQDTGKRLQWSTSGRTGVNHNKQGKSQCNHRNS